MSGTTFIGIMTFANFVLLLALAYYILKGKSENFENVQREPVDFPENLKAYLEEKPEPSYSNPATIEQILGNHPKEEIYMDQRQSAVNRLKMGENPELVASDLGFSRSEIGILQAAARRS